MRAPRVVADVISSCADEEKGSRTERRSASSNVKTSERDEKSRAVEEELTFCPLERTSGPRSLPMTTRVPEMTEEEREDEGRGEGGSNAVRRKRFCTSGREEMKT